MATPNQLITESSPYLLQHAYNPVNWFPWGEVALKKAREEDKMILVSIGYSACHWCHVMEHESFEDDEVAELMNTFFVCIKVDREERPDIDQVYMSAVQMMTGRGGWPLNCFALADGRPVYGGTYFPKHQWKNILLNLAENYKSDKPKFASYGDQLTDGIRQIEIIPLSVEPPQFPIDGVDEVVVKWKTLFDNVEGGPDRAPKFPLPNNYLFLLNYNKIKRDDFLDTQIQLTLDKMAYGGIYDQIGGGFSRYSVDAIWKVPHFEKMLYDNAQLVSLYSEAYKKYKNPLYKDIVYQTLSFIERELTGIHGNYYSALDADSEGVEGKYYTWTTDELRKILGNDFDFVSDVFNVNQTGYWEHDQYILLRTESDDLLSEKYNLDVHVFRDKLESLKSKLLLEREKKIKPGLDDKTLLSWNALMVVGYLDAFEAFSEPKWLECAKRNIKFVFDNMVKDENLLHHNFKNGKSTITGFLEDYAFLIQALIRMYQCSFDISHLDKAKRLSEEVIRNFSDPNHDLFYFTSKNSETLITRNKEVQDNVIPASNSQMAINLYFLGNYFENNAWIVRSQKMLMSMKPSVSNYGSGYSNWLLLWLYYSQPSTELVICGENALVIKNELIKNSLLPGLIVAGAIQSETLALTKNRIQPGSTLIYVCQDKQCHLPVKAALEALELMQL